MYANEPIGIKQKYCFWNEMASFYITSEPVILHYNVSIPSVYIFSHHKISPKTLFPINVTFSDYYLSLNSFQENCKNSSTKNHTVISDSTIL